MGIRNNIYLWACSRVMNSFSFCQNTVCMDISGISSGPIILMEPYQEHHCNQNRWATTLEAWEGVCGIIGDYLHKIWGTQHMCEACRGSMAYGSKWHSLKVRGKLLPLTTTTTMRTTPHHLLKVAYSTLRNLLLKPITIWHKRLLALNRAWGISR